MEDMDNISIPREYFNTLLRRAELHDDAESVTLPGKDYAALQQVVQEHHALRAALLAGGVTPDNLELLISTQLYPTSTHVEHGTDPVQASPENLQWSAEAPVFIPRKSLFTNVVDPALKSQDWRDVTNIPLTPPSFSQEQNDTQVDEEETGFNGEEEEQYENNHDDRSLVLRGLPPFATLADIAKVVRGGLVLNMYIRPRDRTAHVAFVEPLMAEKFVMHCKRNDLYIKGKRVEVYWDEKQHFMPGHVARRVYNNGATRNLVVRFPNSDMTADTIREDLEHIHRLEVVSIDVKNGHFFISTNGINWAITARTCMQSRLKYKNSRIEFYPDECVQPLPEIVKKRYSKPEKSSSKFNTISHLNRFSLLVDGEDGEFEDAHHAAARRNVSANDAVWRTKLAAIPSA